MQRNENVTIKEMYREERPYEKCEQYGAENLTDAEVEEMLYRKWIFPISAGMMTIPESVVGDLEKKVQALSSKYANTLTDIENEIHSAEAELCKMLDDLLVNEFDMAGLACLKKLLGGE